jgi:hypothetical protein
MRNMPVNQSEIYFSSSEHFSYEAAQKLGSLLVEACGDIEDGYTETAAWTPSLELKDGKEDVVHGILKEYLGFPVDAVKASVRYKLVQEFQDGSQILRPAAILRAKVPIQDSDEMADFYATKEIEDFPDDGWSHEYLLKGILLSASDAQS